MQQITIYKVLTFILLPFAALFGFFALIMFFIGLANPIILLPVCIDRFLLPRCEEQL